MSDEKTSDGYPKTIVAIALAGLLAGGFVFAVGPAVAQQGSNPVVQQGTNQLSVCTGDNLARDVTGGFIQVLFTGGLLGGFTIIFGSFLRALVPIGEGLNYAAFRKRVLMIGIGTAVFAYGLVMILDSAGFAWATPCIELLPWDLDAALPSL
jgi:hypothetical protein